jgi:tetratricopeptide (TPR) repeat protein
MSLIQIDPLGWLPDSFKQQIIDSVVTFVADQAEKVLGGEVSQALRRLRSDAPFQQAVDRGLKEATDRFVREYTVEDEDLVVAIARDRGFWKAESVRQALLEIIRHPGVHLAGERTTLTQGFADVLRQRVNRERVDRAVTFYLRCVAESLWHLEPLRPIYELQMQRLCVERATEMVQEMRGMRTDVRRAMVALVEAVGEQQQLLAAPGELALPKPRQVYHNLPQPDYGTFIGREEELRQVHRLLSPESRHFLVTIDGIGGIGKSALALEVAHRYLRDYARLPPEERFDAIVWASAKSSVLTADGIAPRQQVTRTLEDTYTTISVTLEREDITRAPSEEQDELVRRALTQQRTLLIVDNLETVDDERVNAFLRELPDPTKAMVTTRHRFDVAYPVRLMGMPKQDGLLLIAQECARKGVTLAKAETEKLYERTGGVPLAIVWSVAQMGYGYGVESTLRRLGTPTGDVARFCFEEAMKHIRGRPAHRLLMALSLFSTDASREALGRVAELPVLDRDEGLVELERLSLVTRRGWRFTILPLTAQYAKSERFNESDGGGLLEERWINYFKDLTREHGNSYWRWYNYEILVEEGENVLAAMDWAYSLGKAPVVLGLMPIVYWYLDTAGRWAEVLRYCMRALELATLAENRMAAAGMMNQLGWTYGQMGECSKAREFLQRGLAICDEIVDDEVRFVLLAHLGQIARKEGKLAEAQSYYSRAAAIVGSCDLPDEHRAYLDFELGKLARDQENWKTAQEYFTKVSDWARSKGERNQSFDIALAMGAQGNLALVLYYLCEYEKAEQLCVESMRFFDKYGGKGHSVVLKYRYALIQEALGHYDVALRIAKEGLRLCRKIGVKPEVQKIQTLIRRLEKEVG